MSHAYEDECGTGGARLLGWASIGIGLAEIAAPQQVQGMLGLEDKPMHRGVLRVLGVREILTGVSILTERENTGRLRTGIWSRVLGDVLDTAVLAMAAPKTKDAKKFAATSSAVMGIGVADMACAWKLGG